eukprot:CAMPEP_0184481754 /NCGR_PEP_ID=MMETSP0113_2-20130426/3320_1 /TAXON_ID=91329 /ORGANISM="Norrisiella sphaerica, Strain BC52" /LENGTH=337 /DNA_ID=CAMNT_0026861081 /DNA_START=139 /DNA_END=1152 /DNA_ORIENTATION=-
MFVLVCGIPLETGKIDPISGGRTIVRPSRTRNKVNQRHIIEECQDISSFNVIGGGAGYIPDLECDAVHGHRVLDNSNHFKDLMEDEEVLEWELAQKLDALYAAECGTRKEVMGDAEGQNSGKQQEKKSNESNDSRQTARNLQKEDERIGSQRRAEFEHSQRKEKKENSQRKVLLGRRLIFSHHIINTAKREAVVKFAVQLGLSGCSKIGWPGVILIEGLEENVREYVDAISRLRWKHLTGCNESQTMSAETSFPCIFNEFTSLKSCLIMSSSRGRDHRRKTWGDIGRPSCISERLQRIWSPWHARDGRTVSFDWTWSSLADTVHKDNCKLQMRKQDD